MALRKKKAKWLVKLLKVIVRANIEMLEQQMEDEVSLKRRVEDFKKALSQNEVLQEFGRGIFESIIEKVIVRIEKCIAKCEYELRRWYWSEERSI